MQKNSEKEKTKEKENNNKRFNFQQVMFWALIFLTTLGTFLFITNSVSWVNDLRKINPKFQFPSIYSLLKYTFVLTLILLFIKINLESFFEKYVENYLSKEYRTKDIIKGAKVKLSINIVKFLYYVSITIFGYYVLKDEDFFPYEMGGKGKLENLFNKGYPDSFFFKRPWGFDLHHFINLAYTLVDFICITFFYPIQKDYKSMFFHHYCTISLEVVSFYTGYSNIGALVMYLHNISDAFLYFSRTLIYSNFDYLKKPLGSLLLPVFPYTRQFLLARCIYALYAWTNWDWHFLVQGIILLLCLMYLLHLKWSKRLFEIYYNAFFNNKIEDDVKLKTKYINNNNK